MKIGITPRFEKSAFGNSWYSFETDLLNFIRRHFPLGDIELISPVNSLSLKDFDLVILSGGSTPGEDLSRDFWETKLMDIAISQNVKLIGICRGAQLISNHFEIGRAHV